MNQNPVPKAGLIYILHHFDEMRQPYNLALTPYCDRIKWFSNPQTLMEANKKDSPVIVILDLECLNGPLNEQLERLKLRFAQSDFVALSNDHSAQNALNCMRLGFSEFLLKPTSPAELAWSVRKSLEQQKLSQKQGGKQQDLWNVVTKISTCHTPSVVRLSTLQYLTDAIRGKGAIWFSREIEGKNFETLSATTTVPSSAERILKNLKPALKKRQLLRTNNETVALLPCRTPEQGILIWGIKQKPARQQLEAAEAIRQYGEISLQNILRFEEVKQETFIDDLTGLYNSRYLKFALSNAITRAKENSQSFSILFIDVDHFKSINDKHGHMIGSDFLVAIAKTVKNAVRSIDPVFRYGGDEFVVILLDTPLTGAKDIGERIRRNIEKRVFNVRTQEVKTTVSIGIAAYPEHTQERDALLQLADTAMYHAKKHTRNAVFLAYGLPKRERSRDRDKDA